MQIKDDSYKRENMHKEIFFCSLTCIISFITGMHGTITCLMLRWNCAGDDYGSERSSLLSGD